MPAAPDEAGVEEVERSLARSLAGRCHSKDRPADWQRTVEEFLTSLE
jgi:hypothetical protein